MWAKTLWINLNAEALLDGMESFIGEFRRYNDSVKQLPVGQFLDVHMKQFKNSVPLFVELKNEALRERHWEELMDKTGECDSVFNDFLQRVGKRHKRNFRSAFVDFGIIVLKLLSHFASCAKRRQELGDLILGLYSDSNWMTDSWQCGGGITEKNYKKIGCNI